MSGEISGLSIHITGIVQGVGFRPFVYNLATSHGLTGWVCNSSSGVEIEVFGDESSIDSFINNLRSSSPPLSRIDSFSATPVIPQVYESFSILASHAVVGDFLPVSPDVSICADCQAELRDPNNRRYHYPFINCTNCGPRFSIIQDIPYDRPNTTMSHFTMCDACASEYHDPTDRRYHAQPTACPVCGPQIKFIDPYSETSDNETALASARKALVDGRILAIKGLGGFHLACDAANSAAVDELRLRKHRTDKPFALMAASIQTIRKYVEVSTAEQSLLESPSHPIILLKKRSSSSVLDHTAPSQNYLGFMLPYTPLHLLLLQPEPGFPDVLVMTSGNISEEPIAYEDGEAFERLAPIADCFLTHDRPIHMRVDDSVVRVFLEKPYPIRRSRGYAPDPLSAPVNLPEILACGAELKNTFSLSRDRYVFVSHHIGDLENLETLRSFDEGITHYKNLFRIDPRFVAVDLHPDYLATQYGARYAREHSLPLIQVQHHHAHLAACLLDNNRISDDPVIGLIFDGTGYGTDGMIWGGEVLYGGYRSYQRAFHLSETLLPGGDTAIRNPAKISLSHLFSANLPWGEDLPPVRSFSATDRFTLKQQLTSGVNCPKTTSMGRLFDSVSALVGVRQMVTYEGQAAIELENLCDPDETGVYDIPVQNDVMDIFALYPQLLQDMHDQIPVARISARFHNAVADVCLRVCQLINERTGTRVVALSGGVWQNITLLQKTRSLLLNAGFSTLTHQRIPANDGGISAGQILVAYSYTDL